MANSKAPSGLSISRDGMTFKFSWKRSESYKSQSLGYKLKINGSWQKSWTSISVGGSDTSKSLSLTASNYYPATNKVLSAVQFYIKGQKKGKKYSSASTKALTLYAPPIPTEITFALDEESANKGTFSYDENYSTTNSQPYYRTEYQSLLVEGTEQADGSQLSWADASAISNGSANQSVTITESASVIGNNSFTRFFRARAVGCAGASAWRYGRHVYARPQAGSVIDGSIEAYGGGYSALVVWNQPAPVSHPVELIDVEWSIAVPNSGLKIPSGASWNTGLTTTYKSSNDSATMLTDALDPDECLWARISAKHDRYAAYSESRLIGVGKLAAPILGAPTVSASGAVSIGVTHESEVSDSYTAIGARQGGTGDILIYAVLAHSVETANFTIRDYDASKGYTIVAYEFVGSYALENGLYSVNAKMVSDSVYQEQGSYPRAPKNLQLSAGKTDRTIRASWENGTSEIHGITLSWSDNPDAWDSTEEPSTYDVDEPRSEFLIAGLNAGSKYYVRVRTMANMDGNEVYSAWSDIASINLASAPTTPVLTLDKDAVALDSSFEGSWAYVSGDGTSQLSGEVVEMILNAGTPAPVTADGNPVIIAKASTSQSVTISVEDVNAIYRDKGLTEWQNGTTHYLAVRVTSRSGQQSDGWSSPVAIAVADKPVAVISSTSLTSSSPIPMLEAMPLTVTVTGAGNGGTTRLTIERAETYFLDRPDERDIGGYVGDAVYTASHIGEGAFSVTLDDLIGNLDDGARYNLSATVIDGYGQSDTAVQEFVVNWAHQISAPTGSVTAEATNDYVICKLSADAPADATDGDYLDIYRLSLDKPELLISHGEFGETYVDQFPASKGGYRFVAVTSNGDYIDANGVPAWEDVDSELEINALVVDFGGSQVRLPYGLSVGSSWEKEFTRTRYLGGSVEGDIQRGIFRDISIGTAILKSDKATLSLMRELSEYEGICHIRTPEGSSYNANVTVKEDQSADSSLVSFSLTLNKVDTLDAEGMTLTEWNEYIEEAE